MIDVIYIIKRLFSCVVLTLLIEQVSLSERIGDGFVGLARELLRVANNIILVHIGEQFYLVRSGLLVNDYDRLTQWLIDYYPDSSWTTRDVLEYLENNVSGWNRMQKTSRRAIIHDWEHAVGVDTGFRERVKGFFKRLFK